MIVILSITYVRARLKFNDTYSAIATCARQKGKLKQTMSNKLTITLKIFLEMVDQLCLQKRSFVINFLNKFYL